MAFQRGHTAQHLCTVTTAKVEFFAYFVDFVHCSLLQSSLFSWQICKRKRACKVRSEEIPCAIALEVYISPPVNRIKKSQPHTCKSKTIADWLGDAWKRTKSQEN